MRLNRLGGETSPYLLQHAENPVHWQPWDETALAEARTLGKPILLSIGYAACHWCHVMAHESFEDPQTTAVMNEHFVCIKIDREERPDLDHIYMTALHGLGEQGGWPLTMFLEPGTAPVWGGTYFPPEPRYGRPSFRQVLTAVATAFRQDPEGLRRNAAALTSLLERSNLPSPGLLPGESDLAHVTSTFLRMTDPEHGGLRGAPKFPNAPIFRFLWRRSQHTPQASEAVHLLLQKMTEGGIYDQVGGGYARYSTDAVWLVPHFEKMLYDNAQILDLLAFAHAAGPSALYRDAADRTVGWLLRDMRAQSDDGSYAFAASEDADSEGEEGKFYVWTAAEIDMLLGPDAMEFRCAYDVTDEGNWEGRTVLRLTGQGHPDDFAAALSRLFDARTERPRPARDDKVLADWNALAIAALARCAGVFGRPDWLSTARTVYGFLVAHMRQPDGRFAHAWRAGRIGAAGLLEDQAAMILAALALYEAGEGVQFLADAEALTAVTETVFGSVSDGFFQTARDAPDLPMGSASRPRAAADQAVPNGNGMMAEAYARLWLLTSKDRYRVACETLIAAFSGGPSGLVATPSLAAAADLLLHGGTIVVADARSPSRTALLQAARAANNPRFCVLPDPRDDHPAHSVRLGLDGSPLAAAVICRGQTCGLPIVDPAALTAALQAPY